MNLLYELVESNEIKKFKNEINKTNIDLNFKYKYNDNNDKTLFTYCLL